MRTFVLTSKIMNGSIVASYDINNMLVEFTLNGDLTEKQKLYFYDYLPRNIEELHKLVSHSKAMSLKEVQPNLEFDHFWNIYDNKRGNKKRAEKLWDKLTKADKIAALRWISTYDTDLQKTGVAKMYPETYLNQQRWNY